MGNRNKKEKFRRGGAKQELISQEPSTSNTTFYLNVASNCLERVQQLDK